MTDEIVVMSPSEITDTDFEAFVLQLGGEYVPGEVTRGYVERGEAVVWLVIDVDELHMSIQEDEHKMLRELGCMPKTVLSFRRLRGHESVKLLQACAAATLTKWPLSVIFARGTTVRSDSIDEALRLNIW